MSFRGMDVGFTAMIASSDSIAIISNNLANTNTNSFKAGEAQFSDIFYQIISPPGRPGTPPTPLGISLGKGVEVSATPIDFDQGPSVAGEQLDVAIQGGGFFRVRTAGGEIFYTRYGAFQPKGDSVAGPLNLQLADQAVTLDPPIVLPGVAGPTTISSTGVVKQGDTVVGQIPLARFRNEQGLLREAELLYSPTDASGPEIRGIPGDPNFGSLVPNTLEGSNVDVAEELVKLIAASQAFNLASQSFQTGNAELALAVQIARS